MCLVEIEKQRSLQPACTFPVTDGMVIQTESEKVQSARKFVLELLFSERIHYCMYCPMSGTDESTDCDLQRLAYRYGLTSWEFAPNYKKRWPVDASRPYFIMDHSRCILCRRCVRACDEIAANHTIGVQGTRRPHHDHRRYGRALRRLILRVVRHLSAGLPDRRPDGPAQRLHGPPHRCRAHQDHLYGLSGWLWHRSRHPRTTCCCASRATGMPPTAACSASPAASRSVEPQPAAHQAAR